MGFRLRRDVANRNETVRRVNVITVGDQRAEQAVVTPQRRSPHRRRRPGRGREPKCRPERRGTTACSRRRIRDRDGRSGHDRWSRHDLSSAAGTPRRRAARSSALRCRFTAGATGSSTAVDVPGRGEYGKTWTFVKPIRSTTASVFRKAVSVSVGKPTITSVVRLKSASSEAWRRPGRPCSGDASRGAPPSSPDWSGTWRCRETPGVSRSAATSSSVTWLSSIELNRSRSTPGTAATSRSSRGSPYPASRSRKQPRLTPVRTISRCPSLARRRTSSSTAAAVRLRVAPRTSGITQNEQPNEQPSWILTKARTRSSR